MCGFVGYFGNSKQNLGRALKSINHRGPDMQEIEHGPGWGVGFSRLSIIDLSPAGMQPFSYDGVVVYLNGEIYNYVELIEDHKEEFFPKTESDVEIVPFLYRKYGISFLNMLNGMFAIVIIDEKKSERFLVRDRFGKKPLFYCKKNDIILFSSEIKSIGDICELQASPTNLAINMHAWLLVDPITLFDGVYSVKPGSFIKVDNRFEYSERSWYIPKVSITSSDGLIDRIEQTFSKSVDIRLRSDVPVGIFLSGGLDSVLIANYAKKATNRIHAITAKIIGKEKFENNTTDVLIPPRFCKERGLSNSEVVVDFDYWNNNILRITKNYEEIFVDSGNLVFYALAERAASEGIKVVYTGVGGDESFGGYPWQTEFNRVPKFLRCKQNNATKLFEKAAYSFANLLPHSRVSRRIKMTCDLYFNPMMKHSSSLASAFFDVMRDSENKILNQLNQFAIGYFGEIEKIGIGDWMNEINYANIYNMVKSQNYKSDMGCMAASVENRAPFLDYHLVELMLGVPHNIKIKNGPKGLLRELGKTVLPDYVVNAPKSGPTMPLHLWFSDEKIRKTAISFIKNNVDYIGDIISSDLAVHIMKNEHFFIGIIGSIRIFALISYILWVQHNVDRIKIDPDQKFMDHAYNS